MIPQVPLGREPHHIRQRIEALEYVLERSFTVPGWGRKFGVDALAGLVPIAGDIITGALSAYLVWEARNLGLPKWKLARMAMNVGIDSTLGMVPIVGDAFDFFYRSNSRNLRIVKSHLDKHHPAARIIEG
ncbi:DUF4112 domain-containing protein [Altererythrobacter halimionae]|uniref:DUF4112 domain-containing protein n=2 Tax=Alteriqipengyuania halimionae TaxID=1926630 RepID=A0A6I4U4L0_9SPHN|nr:DUF4112 domain-containing protein [Alteriqipengyuania halimionae]